MCRRHICIADCTRATSRWIEQGDKSRLNCLYSRTGLPECSCSHPVRIHFCTRNPQSSRSGHTHLMRVDRCRYSDRKGRSCCSPGWPHTAWDKAVEISSSKSLRAGQLDSCERTVPGLSSRESDRCCTDTRRTPTQTSLLL